MFRWMESQGRLSITSSDYAQNLKLIVKAHGLLEAKAYYANALRCNAPLVATSLSLLHHYAKERCLNQAETLFVEIKKMGISAHQPFNDMLKLYMAVGQPEKILSIIHEMKRETIPMNAVSYNIWMKASCEIDCNVASVEKVFKEMVNDRNVVVGWSTYSTLANIYARNGLQSKAFAALKDAEDKLSTKNRLGYFVLITLYATLADREGIKRVWESSKKVTGRATSANYMCIILCFVKVGDIKEAEKAFFEWELDCRKYDIRVPNVLLGAYVRMGWISRAESFHLHTLEKGGKPNYKTWEILMEGWIAKGQMDRALYAMMKGLSLMKLCHWKPSDEVRMKIMMHLEGLGDAEGAWRYVSALQRNGIMSLSLYKSYLRTCIVALRGAVSDGAFKMAQVDGVELDEEALTLLRCVKELRVD